MSLKTLKPTSHAKQMPAAQTREQAKTRVYETQKYLLSRHQNRFNSGPGSYISWNASAFFNKDKI